MEYQKYDLSSYNLHFLKTDKFKTVTVLVNFRKRISKEEVTIRNFLPSMMLHSTAKYPTKRLLNIAAEELYGLQMYVGKQRIGNYGAISFHMEMINEKYTEKGMYEKALDLLFEILFNPHVKDGGFDKEAFRIEKRILGSKLRSLKDDTTMYSIIRMFEEMRTNTALECRVGYLEDLDKITEKKLYEYYLKVMKSDKVDIYILGDIDINYTKKMFKQKFAINTIKRDRKGLYIKHKDYRKILRKSSETAQIRQAKLSIGCKIMKLTDFERKYVMPIYTAILGGSGHSKLFRNVREKHSLAYYIGSSYRLADNVLLIYSGINKENQNKTIQLIRKEMADIAKGNITDEELENAKQDLISIIKDIEDIPSRLVNSYYLTDLLGLDELDKRPASFLKVTKDNLKRVAKKIKMDTTFLLYGDDSDGTNKD